MSLLEVEDIWTAYGPIVVNRGVSIAVDEGEIVTIIGSNGAGKSTLLKTIAGLKRPKSGTIRFSDKDVTGTYADGIARCGVVLVPEGRRIFPDLTVRDNLRLGGYSRTDWDGVEKDIAVMESFFPILAERRSAKGSALSGGQQQMLAIARGLMAKPKILILDEPSLGLAPIIVHEVRSIILSVRDRFGAAVLLVEQNASLALAVADRGYIMQNGRIVAEGAIEELRSLDLVRETYLGNRQGRPRSPGGFARPAS
jgi:branched-chain amino acid transport system ATP-binding protein